jgi:hypothetical protein
MFERIRDEARDLARVRDFPCLTLTLPVEAGMPRHPDEVRLRNLLREARRALREAGVEDATSEALLAPAEGLAADRDFWREPARGAAIFSAPGLFRALRTEEELPVLVEVGHRFVLRPLVALLDRPGVVYVLALSRNEVRLLETHPGGVRRLTPRDLPESFADALGHREFESGLQAHSAGAAGLGRPGVLHGESDADHFDADLAAFFRLVARALERDLPVSAAPLVLAAVAEYAPPIRRAFRGLHLLDEIVAGNPDSLSDHALAEAARAVALREHRAVIERRLERWSELRPAGRAADEIEAIVPAADEGRVESLFIARKAESWGCYEPDLRHLELHETREPGDEDLLDRAAARTLANGGEVHVLPYAEMPPGRVAVAALRYAAG